MESARPAIIVPQLKVLHLEDNSLDADLVSMTLEREKISCVIDRVATQGAFEAALKGKRYDIILSDFSLPGFDGLAALEFAKTVAPDIPFVFLSGTIGEDRAVESLKRGAADYVLKDRLQRLRADSTTSGALEPSEGRNLHSGFGSGDYVLEQIRRAHLWLDC